MKLFGFVLTLALLAFVMLAAASPTKVKQNVVVAHVQPVEFVQAADVTATVQINYIEQIAKDDNSVIGANTIDRKIEVAARARSGVKESQGALTLNYQSRPTDADICKALLI